MTDEQFDRLVERLRPTLRTIVQETIESVLRQIRSPEVDQGTVLSFDSVTHRASVQIDTPDPDTAVQPIIPCDFIAGAPSPGDRCWTIIWPPAGPMAFPRD